MAVVDSVAQWESSREAKDFPYLRQPRLDPAGLRQYHGRLLVPVLRFDASGELGWAGMQRIDPAAPGASADKRFVPGTATAGAFAVIPIRGSGVESPLESFDALRKAERVVFCEGVGTALAIHQATGLPVIAALAAQNLPEAARALHDKLSGRVVIYADNDGEWARYKGQVYAVRAARIMGSARTRIALPERAGGVTPPGYDARDQLRDGPPGAIAATIEKSLRAEQLERRIPKRFRGSKRPSPVRAEMGQAAWERDLTEQSAIYRPAANLQEARAAARETLGADIVNRTSGMHIRVSRNALDKMLSQSAVKKSVDVPTHSMAVANVDRLLAQATPGWSKPDRGANSNIRAIHRLFAPMLTGNRAAIVKLTIKETALEGNKAYTIEALEIKSPARIWVAADIQSDGLNPTSTPQCEAVVSLVQRAQQFNSRPATHREAAMGAAGPTPDQENRRMEPSQQTPGEELARATAAFNREPDPEKRRALRERIAALRAQIKQTPPASAEPPREASAQLDPFAEMNRAAEAVEKTPPVAAEETPEQKLLRQYREATAPQREARSKALRELDGKHRKEQVALFDALGQLRADKERELAPMAEEHRKSVIALEVAKRVETLQKTQAGQRKDLAAQLPPVPSLRNFLEERAGSDPVAARMLEEEVRRGPQAESIRGRRTGGHEPVTLEGLTWEVDASDPKAKAVHYSRDGERVMSDRGERLDLYKVEDLEIEAALRLAEQKYDMEAGLVLTGSREFQSRAAEIAGRIGVKVRNEELQAAWQAGRQQAMQEEGQGEERPAPAAAPAGIESGRSPARDLDKASQERLLAEGVLARLQPAAWSALEKAGRRQALGPEQRELLNGDSHADLVDGEDRLTPLGEVVHARMQARIETEREQFQQQLRTRNIGEDLERRDHRERCAADRVVEASAGQQDERRIDAAQRTIERDPDGASEEEPAQAAPPLRQADRKFEVLER